MSQLGRGVFVFSIGDDEGGGEEERGRGTYESLQPKPVVRPMPPRKSLPSLWRCRLLAVSRVSRGWWLFFEEREKVGLCRLDLGGSGVMAGLGRSLEWGESRPARSIRWLEVR